MSPTENRAERAARRLPSPARRALRRVCAAAFLEFIEGDLEELYRARLRTRGRLVATLRCYVDVLSLVGTRYARPPLRDGAHHPIHTRSSSTKRTEVLVDTLLQDAKFAFRALARSPAFTAVVVLTLGLGIGANTTIFSVVNGVLLQPLPYRDPERLVQITEIDPSRGERPGAGLQALASQRLFVEWRATRSAVDGLAMYSNQAATLTGIQEPVRLDGIAASPALFPLLGVEAARGRTFTSEEEIPGNDAVVLLSHRAWQRYFGGDSDVVGTQLTIDDQSRTLLGVMPAGFEFPDAGIDYWVPLRISPLGEESGGDPLAQGQGNVAVTETREATGGPEGGAGGGAGGGGGTGSGGAGGGGRSGFSPGPEPRAHMELWARLVGRLADGASLARAAEEGTALIRGVRDERTDPEQQNRVEIVGLQEQLVGSVRSSLTMLMGAVGFVLLIACANVANLFLARATGRQKETAVRAALGAGRFQLVRLLLVEGVLLAALGGVLGLVMTTVGLQALRSVGATFIPRLQGVAVDLPALGFTAAASLITGLLFSLMPARGAAALDLTRALKQDTAGDGAARGGGGTAFRQVLVTAEVALSVILLVGAGLLVSSFVRLVTVDPGYDPENLLSVSLQLPQARYSEAAAYLSFFDESVAALEQLPGVEAVTLASVLPTSEPNLRIGMQVNDDPSPPDRPPVVFGIRIVEPSYFDALRYRLVAGRFLNRDDRAAGAPVAVVNRSAAAAIFPDEDPIGQQFGFMGNQMTEIVGLVEDVKTAGVDPRSSPEVFLPLGQAPPRMIAALFGSPTFLIRTDPAPMSILPAVRARMVDIDPEVPVFSASTLRDRIADAVAEPRFYALLVSAFAGLAVLLAAVGIYGLLSYAVQRQVRETAIRRALGARGGEILARVLARGMILATIGVGVGVAGALALTRVLESMLYEVTPTDPFTIGTAAVVFLAVALLAIWIPARRATRIDPMDVLRYEG